MEDEKKEEKKTPDIATKDLVEGLQYLAKQQVSMRQMVEDFISTTNQKLASVGQAPISEKNEDGEEPDLDSMSNTELMKYMKNIVTEAVKPVQETVKQSTQEQRLQKAQEDIARLRASNKDFDHFAEDIKSVLKEHPTMNIQDAYTMARAKNPDKVQEIAAQTKKDEPEPKPEKTMEDVMFALLPTSSRVIKSDRMDKKTAISSAWDEVITPHLGSNGDLSNLN